MSTLKLNSFSINNRPTASISLGMPSMYLPPDLKPWQRIDLPLCVQSVLYQDWGQYYNRRHLNKIAIDCFTRAVNVCKTKGEDACCSKVRGCQALSEEVCQKTYESMDKRSRCWRSFAASEKALEDAEMAYRVMKQEGMLKVSVVLNKCDALLDCNRFEDNLVTLNAMERRYHGESIKNRFRQRKSRTIAVLEDSLGDGCHRFLLDNGQMITDKLPGRVRGRNSAGNIPRPLWQQLSEKSQCDVESVLDKEKTLLSPIEKARRRVCESVYNYHYLGRSATDATLIRELQADKNFLNPLLRETTPLLSELATERYTIVRKFMSMMHNRWPMYSSKRECRAGQICERNRENYLYRVEYQTRRDCYKMLREVRQRRKEGNIERLTNYIENIMSTHIQLKTHRTLPWKWEFVTEVYNILGLAHLDKCVVPRTNEFLKNPSLLYGLPKDRFKDMKSEFGGRNIYAEIDRDDERSNRAAKKVERLEERLLHSRFAIERTYLLFEIARCHFKEGRIDKSMTMAHRAVHEAHSCNSLVWRFNATFMICQAHAAFNRFERLSQSLSKATKLGLRLKSPKLTAFLALCTTVNEFEVDNHRRRHCDASVRKLRKQRKTLLSVGSSDHSSDPSDISSP